MHKILVPLTVVAVQIAAALTLPSAHASTPATQILNPYSEHILSMLLDSCDDASSSMNLRIPLSRQVRKNVQQLADESIGRLQEDARIQEIGIDARVQKVFERLQVQVKDKKKLNDELQQVEAIVATGKLNGKIIEPEQLEFIKKSRDDLRKLSKDPSYLTVMAKDASQQERDRIRTRLTASRQKINACTCVVTTLQKQYTEQEFLRRSIEELQSGPAISKDWQSALQTCKAPTSK